MFHPLDNTDLKIAEYERVCRNNVYISKMWSVVDGSRVKVHHLMYAFIKHLVKDRYGEVVDPTCGTENISFSKIIDILGRWGIKYIPCDVDPGNWACRNNYPDCTCNVFDPDTLPSGRFWFYDPPYMPFERDRRSNVYGVEDLRPVEAIKKYYSRQVFKNFLDRGAEEILVKGSDFYYPTTTDNLHVFLRDILDVPDELRITGIVIYRHYNPSLSLWQARGNYLKRHVMITHTYYVILDRTRG